MLGELDGLPVCGLLCTAFGFFFEGWAGLPRDGALEPAWSVAVGYLGSGCFRITGGVVEPLFCR